MDAVAPGLLLAQGIGRLGNWWNQELFGKPTALPWGLEIDPSSPSAAAICDATFHPTFLYELIWDLSPRRAAPALSALHGSGRPRCLRSTSPYYCFGRFFEELLRIDPAHEFVGLRLNAWVALVVFFVSTAFFIRWQLVRAAAAGREGRTPPEGERGAGRSGNPARARPVAAASFRSCPAVREFELDLDAFEGPFDLLLTLVLRGGIGLREVDVAGIVSPSSSASPSATSSTSTRAASSSSSIAALLELKARALFPEEDAELAELDPEEAAEELARRLAEYRRAKEAAWLAERLRRSATVFRLARRRSRRSPSAKLASQSESSPPALRALAGRAAGAVDAHMALRFPPVAQFLERCRALLAPARALRLRPGGRRALARRESPSRSSPCSSCASRTRSRSRRRRRSRR